MPSSDQEPDILTLSTETVYQNRWMTVRQDAVRFAGGSEGIFGVVEKPDYVAIVPVDGDGLVHLVQQYRYPVSGRYWEIPQGSWETRPDADPETVALAELAEETGLRARTLTHVGHLFQAYGYSNQGFNVYLAGGLESGEANREASEHDMIARPFTVDDIIEMIASGDIRDATTVAAIGLLRLKGRL